MLITWTCCASLSHCPTSIMKPLPMTFLSSLNVFSLHIHRIPRRMRFPTNLRIPPQCLTHGFLNYLLLWLLDTDHVYVLVLDILLIDGHLTSFPSLLTLYVMIFMLYFSYFPITLLFLISFLHFLYFLNKFPLHWPASDPQFFCHVS